MRHEWDAAAYDRVSTPQARWGTPVVARIPLDGYETVLDAGCGTGRVTEGLLERLPNGAVIGLDGSTRMVTEARSRLGDAGGRLSFVVADLARALPIAPASLDAIVSTATFHWIPDHDALFGNLAAALRPGGRLEAQRGGAGNIASVERVLRRLVPDFGGLRNFATAEQTAERLEAAGFTDVETWLHDEPTPFATRADLERFMATVILWPQLGRLTPEKGAAFVARVVDELGSLELDYVRLNLRARRR
jgi:trans-aconitate 2-methyltransferase